MNAVVKLYINTITEFRGLEKSAIKDFLKILTTYSFISQGSWPASD